MSLQKPSLKVVPITLRLVFPIQVSFSATLHELVFRSSLSLLAEKQYPVTLNIDV